MTMMKCSLLSHTADPDRVVATAHKLCYSNEDPESISVNLTTEEIERRLGSIVASGHMSVLEHAHFTFAIWGISRVCSHQLVRHRTFNFTQRSQRYCYVQGSCVIPPSVYEDDEAEAVFNEVNQYIHDAYMRLVDELHVPKEDARFILPHGQETALVVTADARNLFNFFNMRLGVMKGNKPQWEIKTLACKMLKLVKQAAPTIFAAYTVPLDC